MRCPRCASTVPRRISYCPYCGESQKASDRIIFGRSLKTWGSIVGGLALVAYLTLQFLGGETEATEVVVIQTPTPLPTSTPVPTPTPLPTYTPVPTPPPLPTYTPVPTPLPLPTPTPITVETFLSWTDFHFSGDAWAQIGASRDCSPGPCLKSGTNVDNGFSTMLLDLFHSDSHRYDPRKDGDTITFEVKTSTESCCDILTLIIWSRVRSEWSGISEWTEVTFDIPAVRPIQMEWKYEKNESVAQGKDAVWIRKVKFQ